MRAGEDDQKEDPPAKRSRGRPKGSGKKKEGALTTMPIFLFDQFSKPVFPDEAAPPTTVTGAPNSSKTTDWTSVPWSELGQTSNSR